MSTTESPIAFDAALEGVSSINRIFEQMNELYHVAASERGLSDNAFSILYALFEQEGLSQKQLSDRAFIPKQTVSYTVKKLRQEGLITEQPIDGREARLSLTAQGTNRVEKDIAPIMDAERAALAAFGEERTQAIVDMLESYVGELKNSFVKAGLINEKQQE